MPLQQSFLGTGNAGVYFSMAFLCFEESPSGWPEKVDHHGCPFHQAYRCPALALYSEL